MDIYTGAHRCAIGAPPMSDGNPRVANRIFFVADASKRHKTTLQTAPRKTSESEIARPQSQSAEDRPHGSSGRVLCGAFRASQSLLFACARVSDDSAHPSARDTPSPKAAGPHRPDRGLRGWPSGVLSPRHQRANIGRRGTWPLPGAAPAMVLSFSQTDGGSDEDVSSPRKMARPVQTCLRSARCSSKDAEIVSARARQRENNEVAPHRPRTALGADGCC